MLCTSVVPFQPVNYADRLWFTRVVEKQEFVVGEYVIGRLTGLPTLTLALPLKNGQGNIEFILTIGLDLNWLNQEFANQHLPPQTVLNVFDQNGTIVTHYPDPEQWLGKQPDPALIQAVLAQKEGTVEITGADGVSRLYAFTPLDIGTQNTFYTSVGISRDLALADTDRVLTYNVLAMTFVMLIALAAAWVGSEVFIVQPVNALTGVAQKLRAGDLNARTGIKLYGGSELSSLAQTFDSMAAVLQQREAALQESEQRYRTLSAELEQRVQQRTEQLHLVVEKLRSEISDRKVIQSELESSRGQLRGFSAQLQRAVEEERLWLARETHDELGQALTGLKMEISFLRNKLSHNSGQNQAEVTDKLNSMSDLVDTTIQSVRRIASRLRPSLLDDLGLGAALELHLQEFQTRTNIQTQFIDKANLDEITLDRDQAIGLFRIVQEALTNVARHAQASAVTVAVALEGDDDRLLVQITDNGIGIQPSDIARSKSFGIVGMKERVTLLQGGIDFQGDPEKGTVITVRVPLNQEISDE
jgi:signal transduction histidine kinase